MVEWFSEPGFIAVAVMLVATASQAVGAMWARRDFVELAETALDFAEGPDADADEKRDLAFTMKIATSWYIGPALFVGAPVMALYLAIKATYLVFSGQRATEINLLGSDKKPGRFADAINKPVWKSRPLFTLWAIVWLTPLLIVLAASHGSTNMAREIINRGAVTLFSRLAHR